ncbi:TPA: tRNA-uridine aminocarboxypropyltransferase [Photobacterium damselae]
MACPRCGFVHNCICHLEPTLSCSAHFVLLTHPKELNKETNTGVLMTRTLPHCQLIAWHRTEPDTTLIAQLNSDQYQPWLLFPADEQTPATHWQPDMSKTPLFIILDATWQEARKMVRKSPYLQSLPRLQLNTEHPSLYQLRRNQQPGNLCTCEAGIELLKLLRHPEQAQQLQQYFTGFIDVFHADRSGHHISQ